MRFETPESLLYFDSPLNWETANHNEKAIS
jgi:hypothetical protein